MATIKPKKLKKGFRFDISFKLGDESKILYLDRHYTRRQVEQINLIVEDIEGAILTGRNPEKLTMDFLENMTDDLRKRFAKAGLIEDEGSGIVTVEKLWDEFSDYEDQINQKPNTIANTKTSRKWFLEHFGPDRDITTITDPEAEVFKAWLKKQRGGRNGGFLKESSIAGYIAKAKTVFKFATRKRYLDSNPFEFVKKGSYLNPANNFFIPIEWYMKILEVCPSQEWRVLFSLARIGGLRTPSEPTLLKWGDINWDRGTFYINSPKTERYEGHEGRLSPLWPELMEELRDLYYIAGNPSEDDLVLADLIERSGSSNFATTLKKIIIRAGYKPWVDTFRNLRRSRVTELKRAGWTADQRTAWLGHDEKISEESYQIKEALVTDADFQKAAQFRTIPEEEKNFENKLIPIRNDR